MRIASFYVLMLALIVCPQLSAQWIQPSADSLVTGGVNCLGLCDTNLFAGTGDGILRSTDCGTSWVEVFKGGSVEGFAPAGGTFIAGVRGDSVLLSTDCGANWKAVNTGLTENGYYNTALAISGERIFVTGVRGGGHGDNSWVGGGGVYLSTDTGSTWTKVSEGLPLSPIPGDTTSVIPINCLLAAGNNVFAGSNGGVYLSTDNGTSWTEAGLTYTEVLALAVSGTNLFAGTSGGVYLSTDSGRSWTEASTGLTYPEVVALAVSGTNLFAASGRRSWGWSAEVGRGVFLSTNNGSSWTAMNEGLPRATNTDDSTDYVSINCLSSIGQNLLAGTDDGLWRRPLSEMVTSAEDISPTFPADFNLSQNYPNPFNPSTTIRYGLPSRSHVTLTVFNTLGQQVATLVQGEQEAGYHEAAFDASGMASGVYLYRLQAGDFVQTRKLVLIR